VQYKIFTLNALPQRHQMAAASPKRTQMLDTFGRELPFVASARSKEQLEEIGRSGHQPVFSVVQPRQMASVSPWWSVLHDVPMSAVRIE
jgi:hypothetical protein